MEPRVEGHVKSKSGVLTVLEGTGRMAHYSTRAGSGSRGLKWLGIPASLGLMVVGLIQFKRLLKREKSNPASPQPMTWQLTGFLMIPSRPLSRAWGRLMDVQIPSLLRKPLLGLYAAIYKCNMNESQRENLKDYTSLSDLFTRQLNEGARIIDHTHIIVSPCDGKILNYGKVKGNTIEQVKGVHYHVEAFLGPGIIPEPSEGKQMYHAVIYLGPGDCHHFYSPVQWKPSINRHFPGELLTVAPWAAKTMPGLFALNERANISGLWEHGLFMLSAVGAYNVGSITLTLDQDLKTNQKGRYKFGSYRDVTLEDCSLGKGDHVGYFDMGSSIVLVFEAPKDFNFVIKKGQSIKIGQPLGNVK
jgi:phosphatidylserine decarboxylase